MLRRRRRPEREIAFSFDSFLDVVTNVVGIILRLILVAWVGAKTYQGPVPPPPPALAAFDEPAELPAPEDPMAAELERQRRALTEAQALLSAQVQKWQALQRQREPTEAELTALRAQQQKMNDRRAALEKVAGERGKDVRGLALSMAEIQERGRKLTDEIEALRKAPPAKRALRYRTPVSRPLQTEELLFELRGGRVAFIDIGSMLDEIRAAARDKGEQLRSQWEMTEVTAPVGAFKLRYHLEREREALDGVGGPSPVNKERFRIVLSGWEVEPIANERGEAGEDAMKNASAFRRVIESIDPQQTAVTFCVYPDSFPLYRQLRDYLHEREVVVAGRPLPEGGSIASSRRGTASRGQ